MRTLKQPWSFFLFFPLWLVYTSAILQGQELRYTGPLQVDNYVGEADFTYQLVDGDTILNGPFRMQRSNLGALLDTKDNFFSFAGAFEDDYPEGYWKFQFGAFESDRKTEVVGYQYRVNVNGTQHDAYGNIKTGKPDGNWVYSEKKIEDSEVKETLFSSAINFENGIPQQSFRIESVQGTLVGRFLRNGLAHDEWTLFGENTSESWLFNEGTLQTIQIEEAGQTRRVAVYNAPFTTFKTINLDNRYTQILKLQVESRDTVHLSGGVQNLLTENADHYKKLHDILSQLGKSDFQPEFKVKVPYFPLDSIALDQVGSIKENYRQSEEISKSLLESTQLNILKRSDEEAAFLYSVVESITSSFLNPLKHVVHYEEEEILPFVDRERLLLRLFPNGKPSKVVEVNNHQRTFLGRDAEKFDFEGDAFQVLQEMAQYANGSLDSIAGMLNKKIRSEQQQQQSVALEERLISQIKNLNQLIDSASLKSPRKVANALNTIRTKAEEALNQYSNIDQKEEKLTYGKKLVNCLESFNHLALSISKLPERKAELKEKYQDAVWNPFMANIMNEEVKKRITASYQNVLIPFAIKKTTEDLNCDNAQDLNNLFEGAYQRMVEMRDEDTSKLERKLRKEKDPETVIQLFNLRPLGNNN